MDKKIVINVLASRKGMEILDYETMQMKMPFVLFYGVQPTGRIENLYDEKVMNEVFDEIYYQLSIDKDLNDVDGKMLKDNIKQNIDPNLYKLLRYYDVMSSNFTNENLVSDRYVEIMLKKRERMPNENNKQYKQRVKQEEAKELEQAGILINYDLRGIVRSKMPLRSKLMLLIDSIKNKHISSMEIGSYVRGENPIPDDAEIDEEQEEENEEEQQEEYIPQQEKSQEETNEEDKDGYIKVGADAFGIKLDGIVNESVPSNDTEEFETEIRSIPSIEKNESNQVNNSELQQVENNTAKEEKNEVQSLESEKESEKELKHEKTAEDKQSLAYLMGKRTGKIIRTAKSTLRKTSEQLNNYTKKAKSELEDKSQDVTVKLNEVKANAKKKISGLAQEGKKQVVRTYTSTKDTFEKMKAKAKDSEFRKKVAKKIAIAGLMGVMVAGTLTSMPKSSTIKVDNENKQGKEASSVVFVEEDSENKDEITIEDKQETPTVEKKDIELKETLTESIEDNVGIGTKVILTQGKYYADPNGTGKSYDLENFTTKYGNEFEITRINIVTAEGKNVQINLKNGDGMTYSKIKENYPGCEIVAAHLASGNMQVGWTNIDMTHAILNNLKLSTNAQKTILDNEDGKISESERMEIEKAVSKALENLQENQKGEER